MANGYTMFDNDYFIHLSKLELNGSEFRVLLFLLRQSACYKRQYTKDCSYTFISNKTGLSEASVKRAIKKLLDEEYIEIFDYATNRKAFKYKIGVEKLGFLSGQVWMSRVVNSDHSRVVNSDHSRVVNSDHQRDYSIDHSRYSIREKIPSLEELARMSQEEDDG